MRTCSIFLWAESDGNRWLFAIWRAKAWALRAQKSFWMLGDQLWPLSLAMALAIPNLGDVDCAAGQWLPLGAQLSPRKSAQATAPNRASAT